MIVKKIALVASAIAFAGMVQASNITWSWWMDNQVETDVSFGIANSCKLVRTFELSAIYSESKASSGFQWSFFGLNNSANSDCGLQLAFLLNNGNKPCAQIGCLNFSEASTFNLGFLNFSDKASVQVGLLNFNANGFLPVFPFVNIDKALFK